MLPGPGVGWYKTNTNVSRKEKPMMAAVGTKIDLKKRAIRNMVIDAMSGASVSYAVNVEDDERNGTV